MNTAEQLDDPTTALATIIQPLESSKATIVREAFASMIAQVEAWQTEARGLVVTSEDQIPKMKRARLLRLEVKEARVKLEKKRKAMKEGIVLEGRAIDGAFAIFESFAKPIETHLLEQERFAERAESARKDALRSARTEALLALDVIPAAMPGAIGEMSEEAWASVLDDAKAARAARLEEARIAEEAHVEALRIVAEKEAARKAEAAKAEGERRAREEAQRIENERLKAEAAAREAELSKERAAREASEKAAMEREVAAKREAHEADQRQRAEQRAELDAVRAEAAAREKAAQLAKAEAEARAEELQQKEAMRVAAQAESKKPTKAKYIAMIQALTEISQWDRGSLDQFGDEEDVHSVSIARTCLTAIGEAPSVGDCKLEGAA
jgi:hypothetical protein